MAALRYLPLTEANMVGFAAPLLLTALTYPILGEKVGLRRWAAVIVGFAGVLDRPSAGTAVFHWASLLPLVDGVLRGHLSRPHADREADRGSGDLDLFSRLIGALSMSLVVPLYLDATRTHSAGRCCSSSAFSEPSDIS